MQLTREEIDYFIDNYGDLFEDDQAQIDKLLKKYAKKEVYDSETPMIFRPDATGRSPGLFLIFDAADMNFFDYLSEKDLNSPYSFGAFEKSELSKLELNNPDLKFLNNGPHDDDHLEEVVITSPLEKLGNNIFKDCINLKSVILPNTLKSIGINAFNGCGALKEIVLPDSLEEISLGAFKNCNNIKIKYHKHKIKVAPIDKEFLEAHLEEI